MPEDVFQFVFDASPTVLEKVKTYKVTSDRNFESHLASLSSPFHFGMRYIWKAYELFT